MYIIVGLIGVADLSLFHHYHEIITGKRIKRCANASASVHVILMNIGVVAANGLADVYWMCRVCGGYY